MYALFGHFLVNKLVRVWKVLTRVFTLLVHVHQVKIVNRWRNQYMIGSVHGICPPTTSISSPWSGHKCDVCAEFACVCLCVVFLPLSVGVCQAAVTELRGKWEKCVSIRHTHEHTVTITTSRTHTYKKTLTWGNSAPTHRNWMTNTLTTHLFRKH